MATTDEFQAALASNDRLGGLRRVAEQELRAGRPREQVIAKLEELHSDLRRRGKEDDEDVVLEVLASAAELSAAARPERSPDGALRWLPFA